MPLTLLRGPASSPRLGTPHDVGGRDNDRGSDSGGGMTGRKFVYTRSAAEALASALAENRRLREELARRRGEQRLAQRHCRLCGHRVCSCGLQDWSS
jgi:hypothetical protein